MRQRVLSILAWVALTLLATSIGLLAISTVGNVLRGSGPLGEDVNIAVQPQAVQPQEVPSGPVSVRQSTHHHSSATLTARCVGRTATMLDSQPAPGATVVGSDLGPDEDVHLDLDVNGTAVRLEVYCNRGEPRLVIETRS